MAERPRIVLVAGRGEVVRNFLYSQTLERLAEEADVTLLSVVTGEDFVGRARPHLREIHPLREVRTPKAAGYLRTLVENAHDRWLWSEVAKNNWELRDRRARSAGTVGRRLAVKVVSRLLARRPILEGLTRLEQELAYRSRPTREFDALLDEIRPHLVFNGSHIHGQAAELPVRVASKRGIPTATFIFSWDNLTSRSRIFAPYDHYFVWTEGIRRDLLNIYPRVPPDHVVATGTPQFDYHSRDEFRLSRKDLCSRLGIDPSRPFVLYTTGIDNHFYEEHHHVESVARLLGELDLPQRPQLVVRTYAKGTSDDMRELERRGLPETVFRPGLWDDAHQTPHFADLAIYTSLLHHTALGINAASTVSLELMLFDKPVINLDFDPPGVELPWCLGYGRHIRFDHFRPVAESGATMVARSEEDMRVMLQRGLSEPEADSDVRQRFLRQMFSDQLDGRSGRRVADELLRIARGAAP